MALVHSPSITTRNLVLNYDFANIKSYPKSGTTVTSYWSPGVTAGTLTNGPSFSESKVGIVTFDGTNDFATFDIGSGNLAEPMSMEFWCYPKDGNVKMLASWAAYSLYFAFNLYIGYNTANSDSYGFSYSSGEILNKWNHFIFEMRSNVSYTNNKIYHNGVNKTLSQVLGSGENSSFRNFNNGVGRIACREPGNENLHMSCDIACFRIYKGALTQDEVNTNFNALRGRFGL